LYRQTANSEMEETPLTKMVMSNVGESVENPKFEWGMESRDDRYVTATGAYTDSGLSSSIGSNPATQTALNAVVYIKMAEASQHQFVVNEEVQIRMLTAIPTNTHNEGILHAQVTAKAANGSSSYIAVKLLEKDIGNGIDGGTTNVLARGFTEANSTVYVSPIAPAMPEGSTLPWSRYREATEQYNYCQTFMAGLGLTGEELSNAQRFTESTYNRYWRQLDEKFNTYLERTILWSTRRYDNAVSVDMGNGAQPVSQYRTGGLRWALKELGGSANIINVQTTGAFMDYDFTGKTAEEGTYDFLKLLMLKLSKKSGKTKKMFVSDETYLFIMNLFESMSNIQIDTNHKDAWGFRVTMIHGLNCTLELHQHADLSCNPSMTRTSFIVEPGKIGWRSKKGRDKTVIRSVKELAKQTKVENGFGWRDATKEGIVMEGGLIYDDLDGMAMIIGLGRDFAS
jgi:hypothetical protein